MGSSCIRPMDLPTTCPWSTWKPIRKLRGSKRGRVPGESRSYAARIERDANRAPASFAYDEDLLFRDAAGEAIFVCPRPQDGGPGQLDRLLVAHIRGPGHASVQRVAYVRPRLALGQ